jgi:hypothetical protein
LPLGHLEARCEFGVPPDQGRCSLKRSGVIR